MALRQSGARNGQLNFFRKTAAFLLLFSFVFPPLGTYAQESESQGQDLAETTEAQDENVSPRLPPEVEDVIPESDRDTEEDSVVEIPVSDESEDLENKDTEPEAQTMSMSMSSDTEGGLVFINNEITRSSAPLVDTQTGALKYEFALTVPPGRNGMTPDLRLEYNSNDTSNTNIFGYGWSISIPSITRVNKTGINNLYSHEEFESSLDGELVQVSTTTYQARVENGAFRQYIYENDTWTVFEKDGIQLVFGSTTQASRDNPGNSSQIYSWQLEEMRDANGNYITYEYFKDAGQIYPDSITYTNHAESSGIFSIDFTHESRPDDLVSYETGFMATTTYRISEIQASVNGSWVKKYEMDYTSGHNGNRSLLDSITISGRDEEGDVTTLPSTNFAYETYLSGDKVWTEDENWDVPVNIVREREGYEDGARFVEINGDSLVDIIQSSFTSFFPTNTDPVNQEVYLNNGDEWVYTDEWIIPKPYDGRFGFAGGYIYETNQANMDMGARFADVNGDGFTDILWSYSVSGAYIFPGSPMQSYSYEIQDVYISNGVNGWATSSEWILPEDILFSTGARDAGGMVVDVNGDGLVDLFRSTDSVNRVYLNTGNGWELASSTWHIPEEFVLDGGGYDLGSRLTDINGDGLVDIVRSFETDKTGGGVIPDAHRVYLNNGNGWTAVTWNVPFNFSYQNTDGNIYSFATRLIDVNGDNLADAISSSGNAASYFPDYSRVYLNTGKGWAEDSSWTLPPYFKFRYTKSGYEPIYTESGVAAMDADGDNMVDFVKAGPLNSYPSYPQDYGVYLHQGSVPDLLSLIEYPEGGEIEVGYEQSARYKEEGDLTNPALSYNLNTVNSVTFEDGENSPFTNTYEYGGGLQFYLSPLEKQFAGFATTSTSDGRGNMSYSYIHQGNNTALDIGEYDDSFAKIGKTFLIELYDDDENLYERQTQRWDSQPLTASSTYIFNTRQLIQQYDGDEDSKDSATEYLYGTTTGNILEIAEWGEVMGSADGSFSDIGSDKRVTTYNYATSSGRYITALPSQTTVVDQSDSKVRESKFYYDNQSLGLVDIGNLTKTENWITGGDYAENSRSYNSYGLVIEDVNPRFASTTYTYDIHNLYPALTTNALSQTASTTHDYSSGKIQSVFDANGYTSSYIYDGLDRILEEYKPSPNDGSPVRILENEYTDTRNNFAIKTSRYMSTSSPVTLYRYLDGFGRTVQERSQSEDSEVYVVNDWIYGDDGLIEKESLPYFDEDENKTEATSEEELLITYEYDALGRSVSVGNVVGETTTEYDQWGQVITDALGNIKEYTYDAYKQLIGVGEHNDSDIYHTTYEWNHNNQLVKIIDALDNIRNFNYDGLGRRLIAEDLHAPEDITFGSWEYSYDQAGNLVEVTDPKGQVTESSYDLLNRKITEDFTGLAGIESTHVYDSCLNGIGYLCEAVSASATISYSYTPNGLVEKENSYIDDLYYSTTYSYDWLGNQTELVYPDNSAVKYTYNPSGKLETIHQRESDGTYQAVVTDFDYSPHGLVTYQANANCTYNRNIYDPAELYRLYRQISGPTFNCGPDYESESLILQQDYLNPTQFFNEQGEFFDEYNTEASLSNKSQDEYVASSSDIVDIAETDGPLLIGDMNSVNDLSPTAKELKLKASKDNILGLKVEGNLVKYAYKTDNKVDLTEVGDQAIQESKKAGLKLSGEVLDKRTNNSRTFATDKPNIFITEIIPGDSAYYEDEDGEWWLVEYATTTKDSYDLQISETTEQTKGKKLTSLFKYFIRSIHNFITPQKLYAATSIFYPGSSYTDGEIYKENDTSWSSTRNAIAGRVANYTASTIKIISQKGTAYGSDRYGIWRAFLLFNTSSIPDGASILSANLDVYVTNHSISGSEKRIFAVYANTDEDHYLDKKDYDLVGSVPYGESDGAFTNNSYESIPFNSDGLSGISKTGVTRIALRTYYDLYDVAPTDSSEMQVDFRASEYSGTNYDPKLVVIYNSTPSVPVYLEAESQANPVDLADKTPELSAIYVDSEPTDDAIAYRIQVSTSDSIWSSLLWDSGKQYFSTPLDNGYRSEEITYDGDFLSPDITYYWRIKFWETGDLEGAWSTESATFSLASSTAPLLFDTIYEYDAVGNIISTIDYLNRESPLAKVYNYDDLYRLTSVGTSSATVYMGDTVVIQPDHTSGKDTYWGTHFYTGGNPDYPTMAIGGGGYDHNYSYIEFPLDGVPPSEDIEYAQIHLYHAGAGSSNIMKSHRITESWEESEVNAGSSPAASDEGLSWYSVPDNDWVVMDITEVVKSWQDGTYENYGLKMEGYESSVMGKTKHLVTSDATTTPELHPKLVIKRNDEVDIPLISLGTSTNIVSSYSYDPLGNIASSSVSGSYLYTGGGMANPHAATSIGGVGLSYDNNGNLTTFGTNSYSWDYNNRLLTANDGLSTNTYAYNYLGNRVSKVTSGGTTIYPNELYELSGSTSTKHVYANGGLIASIYGTGTTTASTTYLHTDHLGSTRLVTDDAGEVVQSLDYTAFGNQESNTASTTLLQNHQYTSHEYDEETSLNYMKSRYQNPTIGKFLSQDPVSLAWGNWNEVGEMTRIDTNEFLMQPQKHNSYSYAGNNPIKYVDPQGESYWELNAGVAANPYAGNFGLKIDFENSRMDFTYGGGPAAGASVDLSLLYNSNDLPEAHSYITEEVEGVAGYGLIGRGTYGAQIGSPKPGDIEFNGGISYGIGAGGGLSAAMTANHSFTLVDYPRGYNILKAALAKFAENLKAYSDFQKEIQRKSEDKD